MKKNPGVAAVLSFIFAGAGQIYNGQILKGVLIVITFWLLGGIVVTLMLANMLYWNYSSWLYIVAPFLFVLWGYSVVDAYKSAEKINKKIANKEGENEATRKAS